ncbi:MAG: flavodoxin family protein [Candidatus Schekmanbacteria bacterium]|nr:MAG: flavodoxin family protein [Candidatus Schekmanbacteria bacterium]
MKDVKLSDSAKETVEIMLTAWPAIVRERWRDKILHIAKLYGASKGCDEVDDKTLIETIDLWPLSENKWRLKSAIAKSRGESLQMGFKKDMPGFTPSVSSWSAPSEKRIAKSKKEKLKVTAVLGSPRKGGNTDILLDKMLDGAQSAGAETEKIVLSKLDIKFCTGCDACTKKNLENYCTIKDDMTRELYKKFVDCDILIEAFPIYTGRESAMLANYHDRLYGLGRLPWTWETEELRKGAIIVTWGAPGKSSFENVIEHHINLMAWHGIIVEEAVYASFCTEKGIIASDEDGLKKAFEAGRKIVEL